MQGSHPDAAVSAKPQELSLHRQFMHFAVPSVVAQLVYSLYTVVDAAFVARGVSDTALTAVNLAFPLMQVLFSISLLFAAGCSALTAVNLGAGNRKRASAVFTQTVVMQLLLAAGMIAVLFPLRAQIALFLGAPDAQTQALVVDYITWIIPFIPAFLLSYTFEILMKADGFPRKASMIVLLSVIGNIGMDYLFVIVLRRGIAGAALATSLVQCCVIAVYLFHFVVQRKGSLRFCRHHPDWSLPGKVFRNGFSAGLTELSAGFVTFVMNHAIVYLLDDNALISFAVASYINTLAVMSITGGAQGSQPLISYEYGKKNLPDCRLLLHSLLRLSACVAALALLLFEAGAPVLVHFYISAANGSAGTELIASSVHVLRIYILSLAFAWINIAASGYFSAILRPGKALFLSVLRGYLAFIAALPLLVLLLGGDGIWFAPLAAEAVTTVFSIGLLRADRKAPVR